MTLPRICCQSRIDRGSGPGKQLAPRGDRGSKADGQALSLSSEAQNWCLCVVPASTDPAGSGAGSYQEDLGSVPRLTPPPVPPPKWQGW